jgi:hypothetical protein
VTCPTKELAMEGKRALGNVPGLLDATMPVLKELP